MSKTETRGRPDEDSVKISICLRRPTEQRVRAFAAWKGITRQSDGLVRHVPFSRAVDELLGRALTRAGF